MGSRRRKVILCLDFPTEICDNIYVEWKGNFYVIIGRKAGTGATLSIQHRRASFYFGEIMKMTKQQQERWDKPWRNMTVKCICGKEFIKKNGMHKYCSIECKNHGQLRRPYTRTCKKCGKEFHPFNNLGMYCSAECYNEYKRENSAPSRRVKSITRICIVCGKEFHPYSGTIRKEYCGKSCYWEDYRKKKSPPEKKICKFCGKEFFPWTKGYKCYRKSAQYCSNVCAGKGRAIMGESKNRKKWEHRSEKGKSAKLDMLWRKAVYERAGNVCEYCGKSGRINAHHIFSRSNYSVRWDLLNGICLCVGCHIFGTHSFHKAPAEMIDWLRQKRGEAWYEELRVRAKAVMKPEEAKEKYKNDLIDAIGKRKASEIKAEALLKLKG